MVSSDLQILERADDVSGGNIDMGITRADNGRGANDVMSSVWESPCHEFLSISGSFCLSTSCCLHLPQFLFLLTPACVKSRFCTPSDIGTISLYLGRYLQVKAPVQLCVKLFNAALHNMNKLSADELAAVIYLVGSSGFKAKDS